MAITQEALEEAFGKAFGAPRVVSAVTEVVEMADPVAGAVGFHQDFLGLMVKELRKADLLYRKNVSRTSTRFWEFQRPLQ